MTPDMRFEALVVSQSVNVLNDLLKMMEDLPIDANVCMMRSRATDLLAQRDFDLLVLDCEPGNGAEVLARKYRGSPGRRKMLIATVADDAMLCEDISETGADIVIHKPFTACSKHEFRDLVYSRMVTEWRREPRYAVNWLVAAMDAGERPVPLTMMDVSEGCVGFSYAGNVGVSDLLKFQLLLPGANHVVRFDARVLWTVSNNTAGAEIERIASPDSNILRSWLQNKRPGNKPETGQSLSCL